MWMHGVYDSFYIQYVGKERVRVRTVQKKSKNELKRVVIRMIQYLRMIH